MLHAQLYFYLFYIFRKWLHLTWNVFLFGGQSSSCPCSCSCSFGHFFFAVFWVKRKPKYLTWFHVILLLKFRFCNSPYQSITCLRQRHSGGVSYQHPTRHEKSGFSLVNHFLTCCCDGCCQMTEYARNSNVQVSFMKLVALSNYRIKDKSLLNI